MIHSRLNSPILCLVSLLEKGAPGSWKLIFTNVETFTPELLRIVILLPNFSPSTNLYAIICNYHNNALALWTFASTSLLALSSISTCKKYFLYFQNLSGATHHCLHYSGDPGNFSTFHISTYNVKPNNSMGFFFILFLFSNNPCFQVPMSSNKLKAPSHLHKACSQVYQLFF